MPIRLIIPVWFFLVLCATALFWWLAVPDDAKQLMGLRKAKTGERGEALKPAMSPPVGRALKTPLALLALDISGSMASDRDFKQSLAAEIFSFFYGRLSERDVEAGRKKDINLGVIFFPENKSSSRAITHRWPNGLPWSPLSQGGKPYQQQIDDFLESLATVLEKHIGSPKTGDKRGGGTPHGSAVVACDQVIAEYKKRFGPDADVFLVYFTDEPMAGKYVREAEAAGVAHLNFKKLGPDIYEPYALTSGVETFYYYHQDEPPHAMIGRFLEGIKLSPRDITRQIKEGLSVSGMTQLMPIVVKYSRWAGGGSQPRLKTDDGKILPLRGRGNTFYTLVDPASPFFASSSTLFLEEARLARPEVTLYYRDQWTLAVEPQVISLLDRDQAPRVVVRHTGGEPGNLPGAQTAEIIVRKGDASKSLPGVALQFDAAEAALWGNLPELDLFSPIEEYAAKWREPGGTDLTYPFRLTADFDMRYRDKRTSRTGISVNLPDLIPNQP